MTPTHRRLHAISYSRRGLLLSCGLLLFVGTLLAAVLLPALSSGEADRAPPPPSDPLEEINHFFMCLEAEEPTWEEDGGVAAPPLGLPAWQGEWTEHLRRLTEEEPPREGAALALGRWLALKARYAEAAEVLERANRLTPHPLLRRALLETLFQGGRLSEIEQLADDPLFAAEMEPHFRLRVAERRRDWRSVLRHYPAAAYSNQRPEWVAFALAGALVWGGILLNLRSAGPRLPFLLLSLAAFALGVLSTCPTVIALMAFDPTLGLDDEAGFLPALLYNLLSVAPREEGFKLLAFLPLLVFLPRHATTADLLVLGGMVGLGFAAEENLSYQLRSAFGGVQTSRLVTANFLHICLTGANALAATRALRAPRRWGQEALVTFALTLALHALHNALLTAPVPGWGDLSSFSGTVLIGCGYLFFREFPACSRDGARPVSLLARLLWGICLLFTLELADLCLRMPFPLTLAWIGQTALAAGGGALVFHHLVGETIGD